MDKLDRYLDQVCRGIAGPRSLRNHIRRELREHLLDAADEYRAAGISDADALERALLDFGGPEQVRADLEAAHGQRVVAVIVDKAMAWKEKTMKAKWVWTTWAHMALALLIAMEIATVASAVTFIVPKVQQITQDAGASPDALLPHSRGFLGLLFWLGQNGLWLALGLAVVWGWGYGGYGGYRGGTRVVNITNIHNVYRNFGHGGGSGTLRGNFVHGNFSHNVAVTSQNAGRVGSIRGAVPVTPSKDNLGFGRTPSRSVAFSKTFDSPRFASNRALGSHNSFAQQQRPVDGAIHANTARESAPVSHEGTAAEARTGEARTTETRTTESEPNQSWQRFDDARGSSHGSAASERATGTSQRATGTSERASSASVGSREERPASSSWGRYSSERGNVSVPVTYGDRDRGSYSRGVSSGSSYSRSSYPSYSHSSYPSYSHSSYPSYSHSSYPSYSHSSYPSYSHSSYPSYSHSSYPSYSHSSAPSYSHASSGSSRPTGGGGGGSGHGGGRPPR